MAEDNTAETTIQKIIARRTPQYASDGSTAESQMKTSPTQQEIQVYQQETRKAHAIIEVPLSPGLPDIEHDVHIITPKSRPFKERDLATARLLRERCRQFCLSTFFRGNAPVRSLGITSSIGGEGKSFL